MAVKNWGNVEVSSPQVGGFLEEKAPFGAESPNGLFWTGVRARFLKLVRNSPLPHQYT